MHNITKKRKKKNTNAHKKNAQYYKRTQMHI